ncbi:MAG: hypothetical protein ACPIGG_02690 [Akkermansiaceae bacterium]
MARVHRQFSHSTLWSLRIGSAHFITNIFIAIFGMAFLCSGIISQTAGQMSTGFTTIVAWVISALLFKAFSSSCTCPICLSRIWANTGCRKHNKAKRFLGISYRLGIAMKILTMQPYRCPYCGEHFSSTTAID